MLHFGRAMLIHYPGLAWKNYSACLHRCNSGAKSVPIENTDQPFIVYLINLFDLIITCRLMRLFSSVTRDLHIALSWTLQFIGAGSNNAKVSLSSCWKWDSSSTSLFLWALFNWNTGFFDQLYVFLNTFPGQERCLMLSNYYVFLFQTFSH